RNQILRDWPQGSLSLQSWETLNEAHPVYWAAGQVSEQCIGIVSSVKALADSFLVRDDTTLIIGGENELALLQSRALAAPPSLASTFNPGMSAARVGVVANAVHTGPALNHRQNTSLYVILSTLLSKVVVAPQAADRFFELVSKLVGE